MPGYIPKWLPFAQAVSHINVVQFQGAYREDAEELLLKALRDGDVQARDARNGESFQMRAWFGPARNPVHIPAFAQIEICTLDLQRWWPDNAVIVPQAAADSGKSRRPHWAYWRQMPRAKLYECVALALNIDPLKLECSPLAAMADRSDFDEGPQFDEALQQAEVAVSNRALPAYTADPDLALASVPLDCFVRWARAVGWRIPVELAAVVAAPDTGEPPSKPQSVPSGIRTNHAASGEEVCRRWLAGLQAPRASKDVAFEDAKAAVAETGSLSRKAFDRAWAAVAPTAWKNPGRKPRPRNS